MANLETSRPSITEQDFLDRLYDLGIFDKKLDIWAYCAAYALGKGLSPAINHGRQMGSDLVHLDSELLQTLVIACQSISNPNTKDKDLLAVLSAYASAGISDIRQHIDGKGRAEIYAFLLEQI